MPSVYRPLPPLPPLPPFTALYRPLTMVEVPSVKLAAEFVRSWIGDTAPRAAVVLGSGLGALADSVSHGQRIDYAQIPGFPAATVAGHRGELVVGQLDGVPVMLQNGRFHLYEGHEPDVVVLPVRLFAELGASYLIVTNAAGGINPNFHPPTLMLIADHVNMMWRNPLVGPVVLGENRWPDLSDLYSNDLRTLARHVACEEGIVLEEGVYVAVLGPSYETPAEVRMLRRAGADAVGMSTVPEVVTARARGMKVLGVSSITNVGAGLSAQSLSHADVLEAGMQVAGDLERLVRGVLIRLP